MPVPPFVADQPIAVTEVAINANENESFLSVTLVQGTPSDSLSTLNENQYQKEPINNKIAPVFHTWANNAVDSSPKMIIAVAALNKIKPYIVKI